MQNFQPEGNQQTEGFNWDSSKYYIRNQDVQFRQIGLPDCELYDDGTRLFLMTFAFIRELLAPAEERGARACERSSSSRRRARIISDIKFPTPITTAPARFSFKLKHYIAQSRLHSSMVALEAEEAIRAKRWLYDIAKAASTRKLMLTSYGESSAKQ